ncbi:hypothetical protein FOL47_006532 [Perkinsus chesapeaki]|uniref:Cytochrome b561 domain-containing protein n=1 Tax=Perkinsus chesapeaki TaxID=330153 RepID=A0A7J6LSF2_PERCH|nr:hypothetical protein FOL47_006532 [Perkinsus chesapeaki]
MISLLPIFFVLTQAVPLQWQAIDNGGGPGARDRPAIGYDPLRNNLVSFGGRSGATLHQDTWYFNLDSGTWTQVNARNPPPARYDAISGFDEFTGLFVMSTGDANPIFFNDIWVLVDYSTPNAQWIRVDANSTLTFEPRYGCGGGMAKDGYFYISLGFGGQRRFSDTYRFQIRSASDGSWEKVADGYQYAIDEPHARCLVGNAIIPDTSRGKFMMYGGCANGFTVGGPCPAYDTWLLDSSSNWKRQADGPIPTVFGDMAAWGMNHVMMYGGSEASQVISITKQSPADVHMLDITTNKWTSYVATLPSGIPSLTTSSPAVALHRLVPISTNPPSVLLFGGRINGHVLMLTGALNDTPTSSGWFYLSWIWLHGIFMFAGWGLCLPIGAFIFRYFRHANFAWPAHLALQTMGLAFSIVGFIASFYTGGTFDFAHAYIGIIVFILGCLQPINAAFRCHPRGRNFLCKIDYGKRYIFNAIHQIGGRAAIILGIVNIMLGIPLAQLRAGWLIGVGVWFLVFILAHFVCELLRWMGILPRIPRSYNELYLPGPFKKLHTNAHRDEDLIAEQIDPSMAKN